MWLRSSNSAPVQTFHARGHYNKQGGGQGGGGGGEGGGGLLFPPFYFDANISPNDGERIFHAVSPPRRWSRRMSWDGFRLRASVCAAADSLSPRPDGSCTQICIHFPSNIFWNSGAAAFVVKYGLKLPFRTASLPTWRLRRDPFSLSSQQYQI